MIEMVENNNVLTYIKHFRQQQIKIVIITSNNTEPAEIPVMMPMESEAVLGRGEEAWNWSANYGQFATNISWSAKVGGVW